MKITGNAMIFAKDFETGRVYSTAISKKNQDGTYEKMYLNVGCNKDVTLENMTKIQILDGYLTFYKNKNGVQVPKIRIMGFDVISQKENFEEQISSDDDLPF